MRTPGVDPKLQKVVREYLAEGHWKNLAEFIGITHRSIQYQLAFNSPRRMTYNFLGLLAVKMPDSWAVIVRIWRKK